MKLLMRLLLPFSINLLALYFLGVPFSYARSKQNKTALAAAGANVAIDAVKKSPPLWKKILEGANVTGNFKKWKPGV